MASNQTPPGPPPAYTPMPIPPPEQQFRGNMTVPAPAPVPVPVGPPVMVQQPRQGNYEVPREFVRNAQETRRVTVNHVVLMHPDGARVQYCKDPVPITCQYCHARVVTSVDNSMNGAMICLMITVLLLCLPFGICFFLCGNLDTYYHKCPNCGKEVGCSN